MERGRMTLSSAVAKKIPVMLFRQTKLSGYEVIQTNIITYREDGSPVKSLTSSYAEMSHAKAMAKRANLRMVRG
jgi:hypothetical protein